MIELTNIHKEYVNDEVVTKVLHGIGFSIKEGEFISIMGPSGSGKSTLMHIMGFLDNFTEGTYFFQGKDVSKFDDVKLAHLRNEKVGFVFQSFHLLAKTTVFENVRLPLIYSHRPNKEHRSLVEKAVAAVGLKHRIHHYSNQLSGGEKQRVAIARALVNQPKLIFADEPTGNLDSKSGLQVIEILQNLNQIGHTVILVTHETYTAEHAKRIIHIMDGKLYSDKKLAKWRDAKKEIGLK